MLSLITFLLLMPVVICVVINSVLVSEGQMDLD